MNSDDSNTTPYNRVFVLGGKDASKEEFQSAFNKCGVVKDIWMVDDRKTGEFKGVTYVTYSKASEAALAIEELNGRMVGNCPKPLKVLLANDKREGNVRDSKEGERMMRLFIMVPKSSTEEEIKKTFEEFGKVEFVRLLKDRRSGESKGLAFVSFYRAYHCALALEQCDSSFKAVFAAPKEQDRNRHSDKWDDSYDSYSRGSHGGHSSRHDSRGGDYGSGDFGSSSRGPSSLYPTFDNYSSRPSLLGPNPARSSVISDLLRNYPSTGQSALEVMATPGVTREQLFGLLDMTPGLEYCELDRTSGVAYIQYKYPQCAAYAKEKLEHLEYPPGYKIAVRTQQQMGTQGAVDQVTSSLNASLQGMEAGDIHTNLGTLVDSIKKATDILQKAGLQGNMGPSQPSQAGFDEERVRHCNVPLPLTKPFADRDATIADRLFIVSQPDACGTKYLHDVLCRFGNLIDAYFMPGKNYGYAKYASHESAEQAIQALHGQTLCGMRLKVMMADPPKHGESHDMNGDRSSKRARLS